MQTDAVPGRHHSKKPFFEITCDATYEDVRMILRQLDKRLMAHGLDDEVRGTIQLVLAEAMNNIVEHAYDGRDDDPGFSLAINARDDGLAVQLVDHGAAMPWSQIRQTGIPRRPLSPEFANEGGFGWSIITALAKDVDYARHDDENRLHFWIPSQDVRAANLGASRRDAYLFGSDDSPTP